jgi:hypothetical protein
MLVGARISLIESGTDLIDTWPLPLIAAQTLLVDVTACLTGYRALSTLDVLGEERAGIATTPVQPG